MRKLPTTAATLTFHWDEKSQTYYLRMHYTGRRGLGGVSAIRAESQVELDQASSWRIVCAVRDVMESLLPFRE